MREHGPLVDPTIYEREILRKAQAMSVRQLLSLTGLSQYYLWKVRNGEGRLHPRFWELITAVNRPGRFTVWERPCRAD